LSYLCSDALAGITRALHQHQMWLSEVTLLCHPISNSTCFSSLPSFVWCDTEVWMQSLVLARQLLYHLSHAQPFCFDRVSYFCPGWSGPQSSYSCLLHFWDNTTTLSLLVLLIFLPGLVLNCDLPDLWLLTSWCYRHEPPHWLQFAFQKLLDIKNIIPMCLIRIRKCQLTVTFVSHLCVSTAIHLTLRICNLLRGEDKM
jgi:hypothetical protein